MPKTQKGEELEFECVRLLGDCGGKRSLGTAVADAGKVDVVAIESGKSDEQLQGDLLELLGYATQLGNLVTGRRLRALADR